MSPFPKSRSSHDTLLTLHGMVPHDLFLWSKLFGCLSPALARWWLVHEPDPKFWLSVPSWVNNSQSDFWLGICPRSQKMGDNSAAVVAFHLCRSYCINARRSPRENIYVRFSFNISQLWGGKQLNSCYLDHYGWAQHMWTLRVTIQTFLMRYLS